jgi:hypothetical protein
MRSQSRPRRSRQRRRTPLEVTYLANEGFMIAGGGRKILIDALFGEGLDGYAVVSPAQRALLEQAREPFADVDAVFATHFHDDHFNAAAVLAHLMRNPTAVGKKSGRGSKPNFPTRFTLRKNWKRKVSIERGLMALASRMLKHKLREELRFKELLGRLPKPYSKTNRRCL